MSLLFVGTYGEKLGHVDGKGKGLYVLRFSHSTLSLTDGNDDALMGKPQLGTQIKNSTYMVAHRGANSELTLYIVDERNDGPGAVNAARVNESTGELQLLGDAVPALKPSDMRAAACCHVAVSPGGTHVLAANYLAGSVCAIPRRDDGSLDGASTQYVDFPPSSHPITYPGPNVGRQDASHAHMVVFSIGSASTSVLVPDLGSDTVWSIPFDPTNREAPLGAPVATAVHPSLAGGGPRHLAMHPTERVAYVGYELSSQAAAFGVDEQTGAIVGQPLCVCNVLCGVASPFLSGEAAEGGAEAYAGFLQDNTNEGVATLKEGHGRFVSSDQKTSIAAVRVAPGAGHLLVSSRIVKAPGAISAIPLTTAGLFVDDDTKQPIRITSSIGVTPRDFNILVDSAQSVHALVANQDDDKIVVLRNGHEATLLTESVPTPVCLCWTPP